jgi:hypothetical protein
LNKAAAFVERKNCAQRIKPAELCRRQEANSVKKTA